MRIVPTTSAPKRVLLTNCEALNSGDAAILLAIVRLLQQAWPDARITLLGRDTSAAARLFPEFEWMDQAALVPPFRSISGRGWLSTALRAVGPTVRRALGSSAVVRRRRWLDANVPEVVNVVRRLYKALAPQLAAYADADLVVSTGGTYLVSRYNLEPRVVEFLLAQLFDVPLVLFTQSIGNLSDSKWRSDLTESLAHARLVLVRDQQSEQNLAVLGLAGRGNALPAPLVRQHSDVVFALATDATLSQAAKRRLPSNGLRVCISVRPWREFEDETPGQGMARYSKSIAALCVHLITHHGASIEFISTCQGNAEYSRDDSLVATRIVESLPHVHRAHIRLDRDFHTPQDLMRRLAEFDVVVATRMHMAILALSSGTPVMPIEYEFKTRQLFRQLGFERWVHDIQKVTDTSLAAGFDAFFAEVDAERSKLFAAVKVQHHSACASLNTVCETLGLTPSAQVRSRL